MNPSFLISAGFASLSVGMAGLLIFATRRAGYRLREYAPVRDRWVLGAVAIAGITLATTAALALSGALSDLNARPPLAAVLIGAVTVGTIALAFSRFGERLVLAWSMWALVGFQAFRILVEVLLAAAHAVEMVPEEVTWMGSNFDVLTGLSALGLGIWARKSTVPKGVIWAWNVGGLLLLAIVVVTAARSAFGITVTEPRMAFPATWPGIWLPTWLVQAALFGHLLVFRKLLRSSRSKARAQAETATPEAKQPKEHSSRKTAWNMPRVELPPDERPAARAPGATGKPLNTRVSRQNAYHPRSLRPKEDSPQGDGLEENDSTRDGA